MRRFILGIMMVTLTVVALGGLLLTMPVAAQTVGTNWTASFYNNTTLSGPPVATEAYPSGVFANWGTGTPLRSDNFTPVPGVTADNFSVRFTSAQTFAQAGTYTFTVYVDDGARVAIDGVLMLDQFTQNTTGAARTFTFSHTFMAGQVAQIQLDYVEFIDIAVIGLQWGISPTNLTPAGPTATPIPPALGSVLTVRGLSLRTGPYLGASMVGVIRPEHEFAILEQNFDEGLFPWYKIQDNLGRIGWASGRYLRATGDMTRIPTTTTHFDQIDNPSDLPPMLNVIGTTRSVMNLRRRPSERTNLLGQIPWGAEVEVIGRTVQGGRNHWLHVRYNGVVGWIYAPFVSLRGVVDAVPIR